MSATGGSIESISFDGREFSVASDADVNVKLGGFENDVQANGNGTARQIKTRVPHSVSGLSLEMDPNNDDQEFMQERANGKLFYDFTMTYVDGNVYGGSSQLTGEFARSTQNATAPANAIQNGMPSLVISSVET